MRLNEVVISMYIPVIVDHKFILNKLRKICCGYVVATNIPILKQNTELFVT